MQTRIKYLLITSFITLSLFSVAHEYWIAPVKYKVKTKESFTVNCYAGEDFKEAVWAKRKERTSQVKIFHETKINDITPKNNKKHFFFIVQLQMNSNANSLKKGTTD